MFQLPHLVNFILVTTIYVRFALPTKMYCLFFILQYNSQLFFRYDIIILILFRSITSLLRLDLYVAPQMWLKYVKYEYMNAWYKAIKPSWFR